MARPKKQNIKNEIMHQLNVISDTVDLDMVNQELKAQKIEKLDLSKKTLMNIGKWILDGKSEFEIRQNLELTNSEWAYLIRTCPAILVIMQHSTAYADMVVGGSLLQTAIGGKIVKKKIPLKVHDYNEYGKVIGEHYEMIEIEEEQPPNPMLLKFLAENKLSEKFGGKKVDNSKEYKDIIDAMTEEEIKVLNEHKQDIDTGE